jgi:hypothetical protein
MITNHLVSIGQFLHLFFIVFRQKLIQWQSVVNFNRFYLKAAVLIDVAVYFESRPFVLVIFSLLVACSAAKVLLIRMVSIRETVFMLNIILTVGKRRTLWTGGRELR